MIIKVAVFHCGILEVDVHRDLLLEVQSIELGEGGILHGALFGEEFMLRTKTQLAGNGDQVADGLQAILIGNGLRYCDAVGIVDAQLIEHIQHRTAP